MGEYPEFEILKEQATREAEAWNNTSESSDRLVDVLLQLRAIELEIRSKMHTTIDEKEVRSQADLLLDHAIESYQQRLNAAVDTQEMATEAKIEYRHLPFTLVIPDALQIPVGNGESEWKEPQFEQRVTMLIAQLGMMGINRDDIILYEETMGESMMRQSPYVMINIPGLNKSILVCDQVGEATFVIDGTYRPMTKKEIEECAGVRIVKHNEEGWLDAIRQALNTEKLEKRAKPSMNMKSPDYFTSQNLRFDLENWKHASDLNQIEDLTTSHLIFRFYASNNEHVKGETYLMRAGIALGIVKNTKEARANMRMVLDELKKSANIEIAIEYPPMDRIYYKNTENAYQDLSAWAISIGIEISQINTTHVQNRFIASNGEEISGSTYLFRAGISLGIAKNSTEAQSQIGKILKLVKQIAGFDIKEFQPMDDVYFENKENVIYDLQEWATSAAVNVKDIRTSHDEICFKAKNGETMSGAAYVYRAGIYLKKKRGGSGVKMSESKIILELKKMAGIELAPELELMNEEHFKNGEIVLKNLQLWASARNIEEIGQITVGHIDTFFVATNGENIRAKTYLNRAGVALGIVRNSTEAESCRSKILKNIKKIAGIETSIEYPLMDNSYFGDGQNILNDLNALADVCGKNAKELATTDLKQRFIAKNGKEIRGVTYICRAGIALELVDSLKEANSQRRAILLRLKIIAGLQLQEEYPPLGTSHFKNINNVQADLISWVKAAGMDNLQDLKTHSVFTLARFIASNGKEISGATYLNYAGLALGITQKLTEGQSRRKDILAHLKQIASNNSSKE